MKRGYKIIPVILSLRSRTKNPLRFKNGAFAFAQDDKIIRKFCLFLIILFLSGTHVISQNVFPLIEGTIVVLPDIERAKQLISVEDEYTSVFSLFDLQSKTKRTDTPIVADYLSNAASQVMPWSDGDRDAFGKMVQSISNKIKADSLNLNFP